MTTSMVKLANPAGAGRFSTNGHEDFGADYNKVGGNTIKMQMIDEQTGASTVTNTKLF